MLVNKDFFIGEINIPNTSNEQVLELLNLFIEKYETEYLISTLGLPLYKAFVQGLESPIADKWNNLLYGCEYVDSSGRSLRWKGIINKPMFSVPTLEDGDITITEPDDVDTINYTSVIALYVYYWFMRNNITMTSGVGETGSKNENSVMVSPAGKIARAYNEMVDWTWEMINFIESNKTIYTEWGEHSIKYFIPKLVKVNTFGI